MKKLLLTMGLACSLISPSFSQSTVGLIAHWDFNGQTNDVSGGGHTGHPNNVTSATGINGMPNTAYRFNGVNSWVSAGYLPDLNVSNYSICAVVKVEGYYTGTCQSNIIFLRGKTGPGNCVYVLQFNDKPATNNSCSVYDTTKECFWTGSAGPTATLSPASITDYNYSPRIVSDRWYKVIATFNDTVYKLYVDGVLMNTAYITNPGVPLGSGTDSISIGYNIKEAGAGYPYPFKGLIDDIRLYNRVLSDTEIVQYGDTCGQIMTEPVAALIGVGGTATYTVSSTITAATYQWQQDAGTGFVNLTNTAPYSGVLTNTLTITGATATLNTYHYRCIVSSIAGCADTSASVVLSTTLGVGNVVDNNSISVYPNPATNTVYLQLPPNSDNGTVTLINNVGQVVEEKLSSSNMIEFNVARLPAGLYFFRAAVNNNVVYKQFVKQ